MGKVDLRGSYRRTFPSLHTVASSFPSGLQAMPNIWEREHSELAWHLQNQRQEDKTDKQTDLVLMSAESFYFLSCPQVPQSHREVVGGGSQQAGGVGVELDGVNLLRVSCHWSRCMSIKHYRITAITVQRSRVLASYPAEHTPARSGFLSGLLWESATRGSWHHHQLWDRHIREQRWHSDFRVQIAWF